MGTVADHLRILTEAVLQTPELHEPSVPEPPKWKSKASVRSKLHAIQTYLNALEYNYTGKLYFNVNKHRSYKSIYGTAKEIIHESLPIQCLEAVFVAAYLTANGNTEYEGMNPNQQVDRVPISFKSRSGGTVFRHIVLGIKHQHMWGALGLSRNADLMNKELKYKNFSELLADYIEHFAKCCHEVTKIYVGFPFSHDIHSSEKVQWRVLNIKISDHPWDAVAAQFDLFTREHSELMSHLHRVGELPDSFKDKFALHKPPKKHNHANTSPKHRSVESETIANVHDDPDFILEEDNEAPEARLVPLRTSPEVICFKRDTSTSSREFLEFLPFNMFLHNESPFVLRVDIFPAPFLLIVGKPLIKVNEESNAKLDHPYCRFAIQPKSIISVGLRFLLPVSTTNNKKDTIGLEYISMEATAPCNPVADAIHAEAYVLAAALKLPFQWE
ncbi:hypothetical protein THRCLA_01664 [Thraustotheca clavata]|uniref:Vasohibin n=1 Tax=Thraustotheca clavata TaxID=74557 RepID=A0A1W0A7K4_9STRA|nr:hypothetical protein THRCLA_01664 [Thraustotheca clavata]